LRLAPAFSLKANKKKITSYYSDVSYKVVIHYAGKIQGFTMLNITNNKIGITIPNVTPEKA
jgi:hypothetical protein